MTNERACANETLHPEFRAMRDSALHIVDLLEGIRALALAGAQYDLSISTLTKRAEEIANELAHKMQELAQ